MVLSVFLLHVHNFQYTYYFEVANALGILFWKSETWTDNIRVAWSCNTTKMADPSAVSSAREFTNEFLVYCTTEMYVVPEK